MPAPVPRHGCIDEAPRHLHRIYGLLVDAPFVLPGATRWSGPRPVDAAGEGEVRVDWIESPPDRLACDEVTHPSDDVRRPELGVSSEGESCLAWRGQLMLRFSGDHRQLTVMCGRAMLANVPTLLVGMGLGWLLQRRGVLCLHGAAVSTGEGAIALLGRSGAGKSTVTAALVQGGARLLTDDVIALSSGPAPAAPGVHRGGLGLRLLPDAADRAGLDRQHLGRVPQVDKHLWDLSSLADTASAMDATPLRAIHVLRPQAAEAGPLVVETLAPSAALRALVGHWYPPQLAKLMRSADLDRLAALARRVPVHAVRYPHDWQRLDELVGRLWP